MVPENILLNQEDIYIIDWEYSGMNDCMFDIAAFFLESQLSDKEKETFLLQYFENNLDIHIVKREILFYQFTQDILWFVWTLIKEENNENFGDYGINRFKRALNNMSNIKKEI